MLGDPSSYHYGVDLSPRITHAPDGGSIADYPKGWRFLPTPTQEQEAYYQFFYRDDLDQLTRFPTITDRMKSFGQVVNALARLSELQGAGKSQDASGSVSGFNAIIQRHFQSVAVEPLIKFHAEEKANEEEEQRQTIATLKMRVQELTKKPIEVSTAPAVTASLPIIPIIIIAVIVGIFLLRRRA